MRGHRSFYVIANTAYHLSAALDSLHQANELGEALLAEQPELTLYVAALALNLGSESWWRGEIASAGHYFQRAERLMRIGLSETPSSQAGQTVAVCSKSSL